MLNRKKKGNEKKILVAISLILVSIAITVFVIVFMLGDASIEGRWEMVDMRATPERIERLPAPQRTMLEQYFRERLEREGMEIQFFDDAEGLMTLDILGNIENHPFRWTSENGLIYKRIGILSSDMEYDVSRSRLILIDHEEDGGIIREFRRVR